MSIIKAERPPPAGEGLSCSSFRLSGLDGANTTTRLDSDQGGIDDAEVIDPAPARRRAMSARSCAWCGGPFEPRAAGRPQRFCGGRCRRTFWTALQAWAHDQLEAGAVTIDHLRKRQRLPDARVGGAGYPDTPDLRKRLRLPRDWWWPWRIIETSANGSWEPSETGILAAMLPVHVPPDDEVVDVVAWELTGTGSPWWLRRRAVAFLGEHELRRARCLGGPVRLVGTPARWLALGGRGVCILDWTCDPRSFLEDVAEVRCEHPALEARLRRRIAELARPSFRIRRAA